MHTFSIKEAFRTGWNSFKQHAWLLVGSTAFIGVVTMVIDNLADEGEPLAFVFGIAGALLSWWFFLGFTRMALTINAGGVPTFGMLFRESWDMLWKYAVASIVSGIIVVIGLILLIVPGIIAQIMLSLAVFMILEKGRGPIEALKESKRLTEGKKWDLFLFFLLAVLLNIAGAIPVGLGLLVTVPVTLLAFVHIYKKIDGTDDLQPVKPMEMPSASA